MPVVNDFLVIFGSIVSQYNISEKDYIEILEIYDAEIKRYRERIREWEDYSKRTQPIIQVAQGILTGLNVHNLMSESPLHKNLREIMIKFRKSNEDLED